MTEDKKFLQRKQPLLGSKLTLDEIEISIFMWYTGKK